MTTSRSIVTKEFLSANFMLHSETAERLFHTIAKPLPIIDFHNHINPVPLAQHHQFTNLTELWIQNDPYKHRAMRINGIPEKFITGDATPKEKFIHWANTTRYTAGNPLFHWSALELKRVFNVQEILTESNAEGIWDWCNTQLKLADFSASKIVEKWNTEIICTSDELLDNLDPHHDATNENKFSVLPSLRCDTVLVLDGNPLAYIEKVAAATSISIRNLNTYKDALIKKINYFDSHGCKLADHALDAGFTFELPAENEAESIFGKILSNKSITPFEGIQLKSHLLVFLGQQYHQRKWAMQLHIGAQRSTSSRLRSLVGPAGGFAAIGKACDIISLVSFLDTLEKLDSLPRTILYTLNPADNEALASLTGSFAEDGVPGKIQFGPAWWYNDHVEGISRQLKSLASYGLLPRFIGMTTDSRSILSLSRHEYFRRIFCNLLGEWVESGELPDEPGFLDNIVEDVCYNNSKNWFIK